MDLIIWASRTAQVEVTINTVQEGCQAIVEAVVEKTAKKRRPGHPCGMMKVTRTPTATYDTEEWMKGMEEDTPKGEVRNGDVVNCGPE